ncbi:four helix bundle protein [Candidatus Nomurabacteria bacterium]|nr:four helix bundle protein [Candidatus Nomurabacteria bacterium]
MTFNQNNQKTFRFRNFKVYQETRKVNMQIKSLVKKKFPKEELYILTSQIHRALDSIILNIAEGSERGTDRDFAHFLNISNGSLHEVVACLDVAFDSKYITEKELNENMELLEGLAHQLTAFRKSLLTKPTK